MLATTPVHPEGPRYAAPVVYLPGVWVGPRVWYEAASYLAHRGWAGTIVDPRDVRGGLAGRAAAVAEQLAALPSSPVLVGHDAGALVAVAAARRLATRALVLVSPLRPGAGATHALAWSRGLVWSVLRRRPVPPPAGRTGEAFLAGSPPDVRRILRHEDARLLAELARGTRIARPVPLPPTLLVHGGLDPLLPSDDARRLADDLGADIEEIPDRGHWLIAPKTWQHVGDRVHRWLVQRLGEANLELYAEAMADRDDDADEP